jgi:hypothetical protein
MCCFFFENTQAFGTILVCVCVCAFVCKTRLFLYFLNTAIALDRDSVARALP